MRFDANCPKPAGASPGYPNCPQAIDRSDLAMQRVGIGNANVAEQLNLREPRLAPCGLGECVSMLIALSRRALARLPQLPAGQSTEAQLAMQRVALANANVAEELNLREPRLAPCGLGECVSMLIALSRRALAPVTPIARRAIDRSATRDAAWGIGQR